MNDMGRLLKAVDALLSGIEFKPGLHYSMTDPQIEKLKKLANEVKYRREVGMWGDVK